MKLKEKTRIRSRVTKKYDTTKTPYQRLIESPYTQEETKDALMRQYEMLNPAELKREITKLQKRLLDYLLTRKVFMKIKRISYIIFMRQTVITSYRFLCEATSFNHFDCLSFL